MTITSNNATPKTVLTNVLGFPSIGAHRELKRAVEAYRSGNSDAATLLCVARDIRREQWRGMHNAGIDLIPSNDFSLYDRMLDMAVALGAVPERYNTVDDALLRYFAMAAGLQTQQADVVAMEMTKWYDTNYHYIVPELHRGQTFSLCNDKAVSEFKEALSDGIVTKPVIIGPVTFLKLSKAHDEGFNCIELIDNILPAYCQLLQQIEVAGAQWIQIDEPNLVCDLTDAEREAYTKAYAALRSATGCKLMVATYFDSLGCNAALAASLPVDALHVDLTLREDALDEILPLLGGDTVLSLGLVDGRNIWKNNYAASLALIAKAIDALGSDRVMLSTSSSLLHVPYDLNLENNENTLPAEVKRWMAFAWQKVYELQTLRTLATTGDDASLAANEADLLSRQTSTLVHRPDVAQRRNEALQYQAHRQSPYAVRAAAQQEKLSLPLLPTTTIGSFPQTKEVRRWRAKFKKGEISKEEYTTLLREETARCIKYQEELDLDVLVHGEFERTDMVEYFGQQLNGFAFTQNGWVQSYGTRCVKPPIIFGDICRPHPMTVEWAVYAQSLTNRPVKGMLTGPVTILKWSFVRDDQPRRDTCYEISLAIADEVADLEKAGIGIIQIDEPAFREALPLRVAERDEYLQWAVGAFRACSSGVADTTQIHTHMCYSEFNDIIDAIAAMDADVITIECSRSQMELLEAFRTFSYPNGIGPGVYDIHSKRVPETSEMTSLLSKAAALIPIEKLWVNPDCGLKTRDWPETLASLQRMVEAARIMRVGSAQ